MPRRMGQQPEVKTLVVLLMYITTLGIKGCRTIEIIRFYLQDAIQEAMILLTSEVICT